MKVKSQNEVAQSCPTLSNLIDYSLPGSSVHGIFQARVLEWGAIAFSNMLATGTLELKSQDECDLYSVFYFTLLTTSHFISPCCFQSHSLF